MLPTLVVGAVLYGRKTDRKDWVASFVVIAGAAVYTSAVSSKSTTIEDFSILGPALLALYLLFDSLTSTTQEHLFRSGKRTREPLSAVLEQMIYVNLFSALVACVCVLASSPATDIVLLVTVPELMRDAILLSCFAAVGQLALLCTISSVSPPPLPAAD